MPQVIIKGCATSHAMGKSPDPNEKMSVNPNDADCPSDTTAGEVVCAFFFLDLDEPVVDSSAETPDNNKLPAFSCMYEKSALSFCSCNRHCVRKRFFSVSSLLSGVSFEVIVLFIGCVSCIVIGCQRFNYVIENVCSDFFFKADYTSYQRNV